MIGPVVTKWKRTLNQAAAAAIAMCPWARFSILIALSFGKDSNPLIAGSVDC